MIDESNSYEGRYVNKDRNWKWVELDESYEEARSYLENEQGDLEKIPKGVTSGAFVLVKQEDRDHAHNNIEGSKVIFKYDKEHDRFDEDIVENLLEQ